MEVPLEFDRPARAILCARTISMGARQLGIDIRGTIRGRQARARLESLNGGGSNTLYRHH